MSLSSESYKNAMEILVAEEVEKQLEHYSHPLKEYISQIEIVTYALNRLPPLYASSEEGLYRQKLKGEKQYKSLICKVVRKGLATIEKDPIRFCTPLARENFREKLEILDFPIAS